MSKVQRRRSVPSGPVSGNQQTSIENTAPTPPSTGPQVNPARTSKLLAQADTLAKMTYELNLRTVNGKAERLERDVRELVRRTEKNREFRQENEHRLSDMTKEIMAVKGHMKLVEKRNEGLNANQQKQRELTMEVIDGFRKEIGELKGFIDGLSRQLDQLPTLKEVHQNAQAQCTSSRMETRATARMKRQPQSQHVQHPSKTITCDKKTRIREAMASTRRWNRDHKTTKKPEGQFAAEYFKKQSKRDPAMAVFIQRALQKRIRHRRIGRARSQPQTIEEFCQDVKWEDILDTVDEVLVKEEETTLKVLK